jgi:hypothetical protein
MGCNFGDGSFASTGAFENVYRNGKAVQLGALSFINEMKA